MGIFMFAVLVGALIGTIFGGKIIIAYNGALGRLNSYIFCCMIGGIFAGALNKSLITAIICAAIGILIMVLVIMKSPGILKLIAPLALILVGFGAVFNFVLSLWGVCSEWVIPSIEEIKEDQRRDEERRRELNARENLYAKLKSQTDDDIKLSNDCQRVSINGGDFENVPQHLLDEYENDMQRR